MKLYAPKYYKNFTCIADKCRHSCCIGWEIDIDPETLEKYRALGEKGKNILKNVEQSETACFRLCEGERCPNLCASGLCGIILEFGEEYLCDICREHPRFYNYTARGKEIGLGMACEEACRIILSSDEYAERILIVDDGEESDEYDFDAVEHREKIYSVLLDNSIAYAEKLEKISKAYAVPISFCADDEWRKLFSELEYLNGENRELFALYSSSPSRKKELEKPLERALAYFIYRHCSEAWDFDGFRVSLGFCLLCERLLESVTASGGSIEELARIVSEEIEYSEENTDRLKEKIKELSQIDFL